MATIAHLSDFHLLEARPEHRGGAARLRLTYLSFGRPTNPEKRRVRAARALALAKASGATHLVLTGDLTEDGLPEQYDVLGELLDASGWRDGSVTIVPGNHDVYTDADAFESAIAPGGPLAAYASACVEATLPGLTIIALSTAIHQHYTRSSGVVKRADLERATIASSRARARNEAVVVAMHHPPEPGPLRAFDWIDGLRDHAAITKFLHDNDHASVLHGHTHVTRDGAVRPGATARIFSASSVVASKTPLRLYEARFGRIFPIAASELPLALSLAAS